MSSSTVLEHESLGTMLGDETAEWPAESPDPAETEEETLDDKVPQERESRETHAQDTEQSEDEDLSGAVIRGADGTIEDLLISGESMRSAITAENLSYFDDYLRQLDERGVAYFPGKDENGNDMYSITTVDAETGTVSLNFYRISPRRERPTDEDETESPVMHMDEPRPSSHEEPSDIPSLKSISAARGEGWGMFHLDMRFQASDVTEAATEPHVGKDAGVPHTELFPSMDDMQQLQLNAEERQGLAAEIRAMETAVPRSAMRQRMDARVELRSSAPVPEASESRLTETLLSSREPFHPQTPRQPHELAFHPFPAQRERWEEHAVSERATLPRAEEARPENGEDPLPIVEAHGGVQTPKITREDATEHTRAHLEKTQLPVIARSSVRDDEAMSSVRLPRFARNDAVEIGPTEQRPTFDAAHASGREHERLMNVLPKLFVEHAPETGTVPPPATEHAKKTAQQEDTALRSEQALEHTAFDTSATERFSEPRRDQSEALRTDTLSFAQETTKLAEVRPLPPQLRETPTRSSTRNAPPEARRAPSDQRNKTEVDEQHTQQEEQRGTPDAAPRLAKTEATEVAPASTGAAGTMVPDGAREWHDDADPRIRGNDNNGARVVSSPRHGGAPRNDGNGSLQWFPERWTTPVHQTIHDQQQRDRDRAKDTIERETQHVEEAPGISKHPARPFGRREGEDSARQRPGVPPPVVVTTPTSVLLHTSQNATQAR